MAHMRALILLGLIAAGSLPAAAARQVTVEELRQFLAAQAAAHKSDAAIEKKIVSFELTEQLTPLTLDRIKADLKPGPKSSQTLDLLADLSAILPPPGAELPTNPEPGPEDRRSMMAAAVGFAADTLQHLPNFMATRVTRSFDDSPLLESSPPSADVLHLAGTISQPIAYRDGHEIVEKNHVSPWNGLSSTGEFGSLLGTIFFDAAKGWVRWSRWEHSPSGLVAVFQYRVPAEASHYKVEYCCSQVPNASRVIAPETLDYSGTPAYHGDLYVDPASGAILRVTLVSEFAETDPIVRSNVLVQYGPVQIGEKSCMCPVRSVAITMVHDRPPADPRSRLILHINEVSFTNYHRFGSTVRILPDAPAQ